MKRIASVSTFFVAVAFSGWLFSAAVGSDGGITLYITFVGNLASDMVVDANGNPVNNPATGTQWNARDKLEHDLGLFAQHVYQMTEGKHYLRRVFVIDNDRGWATADIRWSNFAGLSTGSLGGWDTVGAQITLRRAWRTNIHEVVSHEFGHYFYTLADEYPTANASSADYYQGHFPGTANFTVTLNNGCNQTIMNANSPFQFCDGNDHTVTVSYRNPTTNVQVNNEVLTPGLLTDANANNDGPISNWIDHPFAMDGWAVAELNQVDLVGHHTDGVRPAVNLGAMPALSITYVDQPQHQPGRILLLDRSGSMNHETFGIKASQYVQEAGLYLYHSSEATDFIGAFVYNQNTDTLFAYAQYNNANTLVNFYPPQGLTDICKALKTGLDTLEAQHGAGNVNGGEIFLMSDGQQTTGNNLWDQVDRAKNLGVRIHTFAYGDADQAVMDQIASETDGEEFIMSENSADLMNLKVRMIKSLSKTRGWTLVYNSYGPLQPTGANSSGAPLQTLSFNIPPGSKDLKFYALPEQKSEAPYSFEMRHAASGFATASTNSAIQQRGRFKGQKAPSPAEGLWTVTLLADPKAKRLPPGKFQLLAYIDNHDVSARVWLDDPLIDITQGYGKVKVYASLANPYLLTRLAARALLFGPDGRQLAEIKLADDGKNPDSLALDGVYTGVLDISQLRDSKSLRYNLVARLDVLRDSIPAPNTEYETKTDYRELLRSFKAVPFTADAELGIGLTRTPAKPVLTAEGLKKKVVIPGGRYKAQLLIRHGFAGGRDLRVNLGQGVKIDGVQADRQKSTYLVSYSVGKEALAGPRDLNVQFGHVKLEIKEALIVQTTKAPVRTIRRTR